MPRLFLGSILGGLAMWFVGFIFWGSPLHLLAYRQIGDSDAAALQALLAERLGPSGSGAYWIPTPGSPAGTELVGRGPNALVHFVNSGLGTADAGSLIGGLVLAVLCVLLAGIALHIAAARARFADRLKLVGLFAVAVATYSDLGQPVFNHLPWGYHIYLWFSEIWAWLAAGAVVAWFLPHPHVSGPE